MPRCSICTHPQRADIDKALIAGEPYRRIAARTGTSVTSLRRHKDAHLADVIKRAEQEHMVTIEHAAQSQQSKRSAETLDVMNELGNVFARLNKMLDACDLWLADPENPEVYNLDPRSHEVKITYEVEIGETSQGVPIMKKHRALLSELLKRVEAHEGGTVLTVEFKHADPRQLLVNTANALRPSIETLAKLLGQLDERPQINVLLTPEWLTLKTNLFDVIDPYPEAKFAVARRMGKLNGAPHE